jgi:hypothetical protein
MRMEWKHFKKLNLILPPADDNWYWQAIYIACHFFRSSPRGGGIEYLHRDPASRRRRRKGSLKSQTVKYGRESQGTRTKERLRVPRDSDQRKIALARASNIYIRQTRPLVREGAPQEQDRNCHTSNKDLVVSPKWVLCSKTDWPADRRS